MWEISILLCKTSVFVLFPAFTALRFCLPGAVLVWEIGIATASPPGQRRGSEAMHEDGERRPSSPQLLTAKLARPSSARPSNKDDSQSTA